MAVYKNIIMKQVEIKTGKANICIIDLPQDAKRYPIEDIFTNIGWHTVKCLGHPNDLKEEDWKNIVDYPVYWSTLTKQYEGNATESGLSLLKANGVVFDNPLGPKPELCDCLKGKPIFCFMPCGANNRYFEWEEAQKKVWSNPQLFIKL